MDEMDIEITDNADFPIPISFIDIRTKAPSDFTGDTFKMGVKESADDVSAALSLTTANGGIESTDLENGTITIVIGKGDLPAGSYVYDLLRVTGAEENRLIGGMITVHKGITA